MMNDALHVSDRMGSSGAGLAVVPVESPVEGER